MSVAKIFVSSTIRSVVASKASSKKGMRLPVAAASPQVVANVLLGTMRSAASKGRPFNAFAFAKKLYSTVAAADANVDFSNATTINIKFDDGVYKLVLPLPSVGDCSFTLKPHETLRELIEDIRAEDADVHALMFRYTHDGLRVSHSTTVEDLLKSEFAITINENTYKVPILPDVVTEGVSRNVLSVNDIRSLMERAYFDRLRQRLQKDPRHHMNYTEFVEWCKEFGLSKSDAANFSRALHYAGIILHFADNAELAHQIFLKPQNVLKSVTSALDLQYIRKSDLGKLEELKDLKEKFIAINKQKLALDAQADRYAIWMMRGGFLAISAQFFMIAQMVWVFFNWDIMEPVTYFVFLSTLILGYTFFLVTKADYTYPELHRRIANRRLRDLYLGNGFNWAKWNAYNGRIRQIEDELGLNNAQQL